ncbi:hypothetical protein HK100_006907 [Physocladia obscura]|uniref:SH3 domain-containing protein n=1 Tax=Physocladia obscura TaxID=109957 RepID=A0AAD5T7H3_9FUNG|nr:hypothetical protein HK100_006907 [Physocladia obscura]
MDPLNVTSAVTSCFTISAETTMMPDFVGYSLLVESSLNITDTASMDTYLAGRLDTNPAYVTEFRSVYDCPGWNGNLERYRSAVLQTEWIMLAQKAGCLAPQKNTLICPQTCNIAANYLSNRIFLNASVCSQSPSSTAMTNREIHLMQYAQTCWNLPTNVPCLADVAIERSSCGFIQTSDAASYCSNSTTSSDLCCVSFLAGVSASTLIVGASSSATATETAIITNSSGVSSDNSTASGNFVAGISNTAFIAVVSVLVFVILVACFTAGFFLRMRQLRKNTVGNEVENALNDKHSSTDMAGEGVAAVFLDGGKGKLIPAPTSLGGGRKGDTNLGSFSWKNVYNSKNSRSGILISFGTSIDSSTENEMMESLVNQSVISQSIMTTQSVVAAPMLAAKIKQQQQQQQQQRRPQQQRINSFYSAEYVPPPGGTYERQESSVSFMLPSNAIMRHLKMAKISPTEFTIKEDGPSEMWSRDTEKGPYKVKVLFDYQQENDDELNLKTGDILIVKLIFDDGWARGIDKFGRAGTFPLVCVVAAESNGQREYFGGPDEFKRRSTHSTLINDSDSQSDSSSISDSNSRSRTPSPQPFLSLRTFGEYGALFAQKWRDSSRQIEESLPEEQETEIFTSAESLARDVAINNSRTDDDDYNTIFSSQASGLVEAANDILNKNLVYNKKRLNYERRELLVETDSSKLGLHVPKEIDLITQPLYMRDIEEAHSCCNYLMGLDALEFKNSSHWFRVPGNSKEIEDINDEGFNSYVLRRQQKDAKNVFRIMSNRSEPQWFKKQQYPQEPFSPIPNIVAGYLKKIISSLPGGGLVTEYTRKFICAKFSENVAEENQSGEQTPKLTKANKELIKDLLNANAARRQLLYHIAQLAHKILANDPVEPASLAVVISVHDVTACGVSSIAEELRKYQKNLGNPGVASEIYSDRNRYSGADLDIAAAKDMRALLEVFGKWNRILGRIFESPDELLG